jgi:type IV pilus assembly protein PilC
VEFAYRAADPSGQTATGVVEAADATEARQVLRNRGLLVLELKARRPSWREAAERLLWRVPVPQVALFCQQLGFSLRAGLDLLRALDVVRRQTPSRAVRREVTRLWQEVQKGRPLSEAMADRAGTMPPLLAQMLAAGEAAGNLDETLARMAAYYRREAQLRQRLRSALAYPALLFTVAAGLVLFFLNYLLPELLKVFAETGARLPPLTRGLVSAAEHARLWLPAVVAVLAGLALVLGPGARGRMRVWRDRVVARIPLVGRVVRDAAHARFTRGLALLLRSGMPLVRALELLARTAGHTRTEAAALAAAREVQRGGRISAIVAGEPFFDPVVAQMLAVGEEIGEPERLLEELADYYEQQVEAGFARLVALTEPLVTVVVAAVVGLLVISVLTPMFDMIRQVRHLR